MRIVMMVLGAVVVLAPLVRGALGADPPPPGVEEKRVPVNSQTTLANLVGRGFPDEAWAYPKGLIPTDVSSLVYVSGPLDANLGKGAWRKPVIFRHKPSGVMIYVNCYRQRVERDVPDGKRAGTPFLRLVEPDYRYKRAQFHDLPAANATTETHAVNAFRDGDIMFKVMAVDGTPETRQKLVSLTAEAIWKHRQTRAK